MSGTNYSKMFAPTPNAPAIILVEPQMGENIGAACRAMWNFDLTDLRIVNPRDGWPNPAAVAMASGAGRLLDNARIFATTQDAIADLQQIYATTARQREVVKAIMTPAYAAQNIVQNSQSDIKSGILFGRERTGLEIDDVARASVIINVPVNPAFSSLNLAQCVLLIGYEWFQAQNTPTDQYLDMNKAHLATQDKIEHFLKFTEQELDNTGFFFPPEKRPTMVANLRNAFSRASLTDQDVSTFYGMIRNLAGKRNRKETGENNDKNNPYSY